MHRWRAVVGLVVCACACLVVAVVNRHVYPQVGGISVTASGGWTAYAPTDASSTAPSRLDSFELWDPYLWVGAGAAMLIVAVCVAAFSLRRRRA